MCEPVSIALAMGALSATAATVAAKDKAKSEGKQEDAKRKSQIEMVKQMNISNADLTLSAKDKAEQANQQMTEINLKSIRTGGWSRRPSVNQTFRVTRWTALSVSRTLSLHVKRCQSLIITSATTSQSLPTKWALLRTPSPR